MHRRHFLRQTDAVSVAPFPRFPTWAAESIYQMGMGLMAQLVAALEAP